MVTIAPPKTKTRTHELQLPSMSLLTTKSSSQQFLLRLLKVIIQLSDKKTPASTPSQGAAAASNQSSGSIATSPSYKLVSQAIFEKIAIFSTTFKNHSSNIQTPLLKLF